jgi:hypothetical protein
MILLELKTKDNEVPLRDANPPSTPFLQRRMLKLTNALCESCYCNATVQLFLSAPEYHQLVKSDVNQFVNDSKVVKEFTKLVAQADDNITTSSNTDAFRSAIGAEFRPSTGQQSSLSLINKLFDFAAPFMSQPVALQQKVTRTCNVCNTERRYTLYANHVMTSRPISGGHAELSQLWRDVCHPEEVVNGFPCIQCMRADDTIRTTATESVKHVLYTTTRYILMAISNGNLQERRGNVTVDPDNITLEGIDENLRIRSIVFQSGDEQGKGGHYWTVTREIEGWVTHDCMSSTARQPVAQSLPAGLPYAFLLLLERMAPPLLPRSLSVNAHLLLRRTPAGAPVIGWSSGEIADNIVNTCPFDGILQTMLVWFHANLDRLRMLDKQMPYEDVLYEYFSKMLKVSSVRDMFKLKRLFLSSPGALELPNREQNGLLNCTAEVTDYMAAFSTLFRRRLTSRCTAGHLTYVDDFSVPTVYETSIGNREQMNTAIIDAVVRVPDDNCKPDLKCKYPPVGPKCGASFVAASYKNAFCHRAPFVLPVANPMNHARSLFPPEITVYDTHYELICFIIKTGVSTNSGHFVALIKEGENWFYYDDMIAMHGEVVDVDQPHYGRFVNETVYVQDREHRCPIVLYVARG